MIPRKTFLHFLLDTPTGKAYYRSASGTILTTVITAGSNDVTLKNGPGNWLDITLSADRNMFYWGINRSYSNAMEFIRDAKEMIEELMLLGVGTEVPLTLATFKYNAKPLPGEPNYKLYNKGNLDLPKTQAVILESLTLNLMEGGAAQLLKSYENVPLEEPCDGSVPENIKVNFDGHFVKDVLYYQIVPLSGINNVKIDILPAVFVGNEGDNYGTVKADPSYESVGPLGDYTPFKNSSNYIIYFDAQTTIRLKGTIVVGRDTGGGEVFFSMAYTTSKTLAPVVLTPTPFGVRLNPGNPQAKFEYDFTVILDAYEKLFLTFNLQQPADVGTGKIYNGNYSIEFVTKPKDSRAWALTAYDLWRLIVADICKRASITSQVFNYQGTSALLQQHLNFVISSGDAVRASNDPTYQRFFYLNENNEIKFGPVIKTTLKNFFKAVSVPLMTSLGTDYAGAMETLFIETLRTVFDSSVVNYSLGEVAKAKWSFAPELAYTDVKIGYEPQSYDQKAGKYETNTTLWMKLPVKSNEPKILDLVSPYRADSTGIERLRAGIGVPATSITRNDSDNSVFIIDTDRSKFIYDYFRAQFISLLDNPDSGENTNIHFEPDQMFQKLDMPITDGEYFQVNKDFGIFIFTVPNVTPEACNLSIDGIINSVNKQPLAPADTIIITLVHNGIFIYQTTITVTAVNTPISINHNFTELFQQGDCVYIMMATTATGEATINTASLTIGSRVSMSGANVPVEAGTSMKLLSLPNVIPASDPYDVGTSIVQYGFQYFKYNSLAYYKNFDMQLGLLGYKEGSTDNFIFNIYVNGIQIVNYLVVAGSVPRVQFAIAGAVINRNFALNDIVFVTASRIVATGGDLEVQLVTSTLTFTSTQIKCYSLFREQYDSLQGIPNYAKIGNDFRTDIAGAPYNLRLSSKTAYNTWKPFIRSLFLDQVTGQALFQTLSKNPYLSRSIGGVTITENSNEDILEGDRIFYPIKLSFQTNVPLGFAEILNRTVNAHIHLTIMGNDIYVFGLKMKQKPALNESQEWECLLSPLTSLATLAKIKSFKPPYMPQNSISYSKASSIQWVPYTREIIEEYHTRHRDEFLFREQMGTWTQRNDYQQPVQIKDKLPLQFFTRGLDPVTYRVYTCCGVLYRGPQNLDTVYTPAFNEAPYVTYVNWQRIIDTTGWDRGSYYIVIDAGLSPILISEDLYVGTPEEMKDTVMVKYKHSSNTQGIVFDGTTPFEGAMRIRGGYDNQFKQKYLGKQFVDQQQDIVMINGVAYETTNFFVGRDWGIPDYVTRKLMMILLMDGVRLDNEAFTLNEGAEWEDVVAKGNRMKMQSIQMRPSVNTTSVVVTAAGRDDDNSMIVTISPGSMGPNIMNQSGVTDPDLIQIQITN